MAKLHPRAEKFFSYWRLRAATAPAAYFEAVFNKRKKEIGMQKQKNIHEMSRREYCSYVQQHYCNEPQWVRTRLISKWDQEAYANAENSQSKA